MKEEILDFMAYSRDILTRSQDVLNHYYYILLHFGEFIKYRYWINAKSCDIQFKDVLDYINECKKQKIACWPNKWQLHKHNTIVEYNKCIKNFLGYMQLLGKTSFAVELIPTMKKEKWFRDCVSYEEYQTLRQWFAEYGFNLIAIHRNQLLLDIAYNTWLRRSELLQLKFSDFNTNTFQFEIKRKWGYIDPVLFDRDIKDRVDLYKILLEIDYKKRNKWEPNYLFVWLDNKNYGNVLSMKYIDYMISCFCDKLIWEYKLKRRIHLHMFRHSFATNCVYAWLSQQAVSQLMWHRSMSTTLKYYNLSNKYLQQEYKKVLNFIKN